MSHIPKPASRWLTGLSGLLGICFFVLLLEVGLIAVHGGRWSWQGLSASNPRDRLLGAATIFALWLGVRTYRRGERWTAFVGRLVILGTSLWVAWSMAEQITRSALRHRQGFNALSALQEANPEKHFRVHEPHALARIVQLSQNKNLVYDLRPNLDIRFGGEPLRTNSRGLREDREYGLAKPPGTLRLVGIGDSGMFGWNVNQSENYLAVLEERLAKRNSGPTWEVLNLGVPGYNTYQEVEMLIDRGLLFAPDVVLLAWSSNDFDVPFFLNKYRDFREKGVSYLFAFLFERKNFLELVRPQVTGSHRISKDLMDPEVTSSSGPEGVRRALLRLKDLGTAHRFRILVFGPMDSTVVQLCQELDLAYLNTYEDIPEGTVPREWAVHFIHPRKEGHALIAEHLERELDRRGWLAPINVGSGG